MKKKSEKYSSSNKKSGLSKTAIRNLTKSEQLKIEGRNEEALFLAQKVLENDPSCLAAAEEISDNLLSLGREKEAKKSAQFAYSLDQDSYIANYILGFLAIEENKNESLQYLLKANELQSNNPEILRCLGWVLFHSHENIKGIATLERALNLRPHDVLILCDLGVCLLHQNIFPKAIKLFEKALSLEPDNERAQNCLLAAVDLKKQVEDEMQKYPKELQDFLEKTSFGVNEKNM